MNGCISNLPIKFLFSLLRLAGAFFNGKRKAHLSQCGSDVLQIASISSRRICFCLSVRVLHFEKSFCCSSVNCASSPSAKNWASVMPNALTYCLQSWQRGCVIPVEHICNGGMGKVSLLCQPVVRPVLVPAISSLIRFCASIKHLPYCLYCIYSKPQKGGIIVTIGSH